MFAVNARLLSARNGCDVVRFDKNKRADARKRYTAMVPRQKGVHMNTP